MNTSVKYLGHIPFYQLVFFRALISLFLCYFLLKKAGISVIGKNHKLLFLRGLTGTIALTSYFYTVQTIPLASAVTLQYLSPIFTILLAGFLLQESPTAKQWLYFLLAFVGVYFVKGFDERLTLFAVTIGIVSALFSGVAYNIIRMLKDKEHELVVIFYFPLVTLPLMTPFAISTWVWPVGWEWLIVVLMGVFTQFGQVFMTRGYQQDKAANVGIYRYFGLLLAVGIGWIVFSEDIFISTVVGMVLVVASMVLNSIESRKAA